MSEMVERIARAIMRARGFHATAEMQWDEGDSMFAALATEARAAIEAMREPTGGMCVAGEASGFLHFSPEPGEGLDEIDMETAWRTMIDEALK